ncbi:molybdopterin biosynthesis protein MoeB [Neobacillus bataviensis LMG 21833]|uniref:Molybdopterin biosynthesis protein MoeB n=1 Tax=Neobacillus bataviensis LMG 21833 TaxID=1117379 RepID=K6DQ32_9BACI|nr:ThiF family adenylyltransferase [Neobacillus bataviensis]EKN70293.1 molybdopterin biosynthesis protein MoeB [Neobacillus bataviensis LMG 21833]
MSDLERYSRQILFQRIGEEGQRKLLRSRVAVVGAGALGTVIANHLVRSGVGFIRLIDRDLVELSNLQRQTLFDEEDARLHLPKAVAAQNRLTKINSTVMVEAVIADLNLENAVELLAGVDVIVDGTDNFQTRFLINDVAVKDGTPWVHGAAVSSRGMFAVIKPGKTPCYRCLFPHVPTGTGETCDTVGVLSPLTDIIGSFQAMETIKLLVGAETTPNLEQIDIWDVTSMQMDISQGRNPDCPACGKGQFDYLDQSSEQQVAYTSLCGRDTVQINPRNKSEQDLKRKAEILRKSGKVVGNDFLLRFSPEEGISIVVFKDSRVLIHGTNDILKAKMLYSKYIGS